MRHLRLSNRWPPLFVVGAPRSGTTVVFQEVLATFELGYFPNRAKKRPHACVSRALGARWRFQPCWSSSYGVIPGPWAPSDGWEIFLRWFPEYPGEGPVRRERLHELCTIVRLYERIFRAPFANKNNANTTRIPELAELFPRALFLHVRRDPEDTVASLLEARRRHGVPPGRWWGAAPPGLRAPTSELELCVAGTLGVERAARAALAELAPERSFTVRYEEFCDDPSQATDWVASAFAAAGVSLRRRAVAGPTRFERPRRDSRARTESAREVRAMVARMAERGP